MQHVSTLVQFYMVWSFLLLLVSQLSAYNCLMFIVIYFLGTFQGKVKQNPTCTDVLQQWHMPSRNGRQADTLTVDALMGVSNKQYNFSKEITDFYFNALIQGKTSSINRSLAQIFVCFYVKCPKL